MPPATPSWPSRALVIGASGAIGAAMVDALGSRCEVRPLSRRAGEFELTDEPSIARAAGDCAGAYDLIFDATGALEIDGAGPEKSLRAIDPQVMARQFAVNAIGPALLLKHFSPLLATSGKAVFATLSARVGSIGDNRLGGWISYRASKAALNQIVRTAAIELARRRPQSICVALHPGTVRSALTRDYLARHPAVDPPLAARRLVRVLDALTPADTGRFIAWDGAEIPW